MKYYEEFVTETGWKERNQRCNDVVILCRLESEAGRERENEREREREREQNRRDSVAGNVKEPGKGVIVDWGCRIDSSNTVTHSQRLSRP